MPKGKKGGKNKRRGKKNKYQEKRELEFKDDGQEYAQVTKMLGNGRLEAKCADGKQRLCHIRGAFRKRVWINKDDVILIGLREFEDSKADVIHKYTLDEARTLHAYEELPSNWIFDVNGTTDQTDDIAFGVDEDNSSSVHSVEDEEALTTEQLLKAL